MPPALWQPSNGIAINCLRAGEFENLSAMVPNRISDLLDCEPIESLIRHVGTESVEMYVRTELTRLALQFNGNPALNLKDYQVPVIAGQLIENYKWESLEDFTLCFRRASAGLYGEIYRIDGAVIGQWFSRYLDEKYDALEQRKAKEKHEEKGLPRKSDAVDGGKYLEEILKNIGPVRQPEPDNRKENDFQRHKLQNVTPVTTPEEYEKKVLHIEYLKEMNASGLPKEEWILETEWMIKNKK
jgi:hypothetical protein